MMSFRGIARYLRRSSRFIGLAGCASCLITPTPVQSADSDPTRFENDIVAYETIDASQPPPTNPVVFVGSSSIRAWSDLSAAFPAYPVMNRGFGGSTMNDLLYYFDRLVAVYNPALVIVYEGDNDLASGMSVEEVNEDYLAFVTLMEENLPDSDFAFISVKPSPSRASFLDNMMALNTELATLAADHGGLFIDVYARMVDEFGDPIPQLFTSDNLHMNSVGYRLWRQIITPVLDEWSAPVSTLGQFTAVRFVNQSIVLEWTGESRLEWSPDLKGPWTPITPTTAGQHTEERSNQSRFFRLMPL